MKICKVTKIEAILTIDNKGQILLPKELREKAGLKPGDRLVTIAGCDENGKICCFILLKGEVVDKEIKSVISPMLKEVIS